MPGDAPAAVHGDNGQAIIRHILWLGALAGGIDVRVLDYQHHVALLALGAGGCYLGLVIPRLLVVHPAQETNL